MRKTALGILSMCLVIGTSCGGDEPGSTGPTTGTTFSTSVLPILTSTCAITDCHVAPIPRANMNLSQATAYDQIVDVASTQVPALKRVAPGQPDESYLLHKLRGTQATVGGFGETMPAGGATPLTATQIGLIEEWIRLGALRN